MENGDYIANSLSLFLGQQHFRWVNECCVLGNSLFVSFFILQLRKRTHAITNTEINVDLKEFPLDGTEWYDRPAYVTGQSTGLFCSLVTRCDHGGEAAFSSGLLILCRVLAKRNQIIHFCTKSAL